MLEVDGFYKNPEKQSIGCICREYVEKYVTMIDRHIAYVSTVCSYCLGISKGQVGLL